MGMAAPHCIAFVNPKCANETKQKKRVRNAHVLNGKQNSAVYGAAHIYKWGTIYVARGDRIRQLQTVLGDHLCFHRQSGRTTCSAVDSLGGPVEVSRDKATSPPIYICVNSSQTVLEHHRYFSPSALVSQLEEKKKPRAAAGNQAQITNSWYVLNLLTWHTCGTAAYYQTFLSLL